MSHIEVTLTSGVTIVADSTEWAVTRNRVDNSVKGFRWEHSGPRQLAYVKAEEVVAVVLVDDEVAS